MRWQPWDVIGGAYSDDTRPWSVQDTVNYLVVMAEKGGTRSPKMLRGVPGMVTFSASMPESPVRGLYVAEGRLFAVVAQTLYAIGTGGAATSLGTIPGVGRCVMTHNQVSGGNQIVVANGQSGYVYDTTDGTLAQITDDGFPGFRSVDFIDQYIIGVEPFGRYWFHSDLSDAKSYSMLDRSEAEKAPDRIQQAIATGPDVFVLGERTGQFFANTGEATGTFQNRAGTELDIGAASPWSACRLDNTVYWLGNDGCVYRLAGYQAQRISTHAMEQAISRATIADAYAFTFEDRGHKCYLLTLPDGQTWCFDAASNEWTRRESYGLNRWRVSALVRWGRNWIAGDYVNGKLYQLDWRVQQEAGEPLERRRVTGVLHDDQNRMIVNGVELVFATGDDVQPGDLFPVQPEGPSISGSAPDGLVGIAYDGYAYTVIAGNSPIVSVTLVSGSLPPGITLSSSGVLSQDAPTDDGAYTYTIRAIDQNGLSAILTDTVLIQPAGGAVACGVDNSYAGGETYPTIINIQLGTGTGEVVLTCPRQGIPDKVEVWMGGIKRADSGYIGNGSDQATLNAYLDSHSDPREVITPSTVGQTFAFPFYKGTETPFAEARVYAPIPGTGWGFNVSCPDADTALGELTLSGAAPNPLVGYTTPFGYIAFGGAEPYTFSVASGALPTGRTIDPATGVVTGTYSAAGTYSFTVRVTDSLGAFVDLADSINVLVSYP